MVLHRPVETAPVIGNFAQRDETLLPKVWSLLQTQQQTEDCRTEEEAA
jgi:hypothetical protein